MANFIKVAKAADVPPGEVIGVDVGDQRIAIANVDGSYYAFSAVCQHMGGPLEEGFLEGKALQCPWHAGDYDVTCGEALNPPASGKLNLFTVRVQDEDIEIEEPS
ncbi:MAG: Rieske 2Fe-2S domain-containing protein [Chloroflexi bacterium]|nr:Rieske 2Fe-2S domain-containing protein [Chloroflexota bacterium]